MLLHRREKVWTKVCMFINFIPMISGLHNQHLTNTHAQHAAKLSEALKPTWKWPNWLFTWQLTNISLFLPICFPAHMRFHQRACRTTRLRSVAEPSSCTGGCGGGTWRWGVRLTSVVCDRVCPYLQLIGVAASTDEADYCPGSVCPPAHHHKWVFGQI